MPPAPSAASAWARAARALVASAAAVVVAVASGLRVAKALSESVGAGVPPTASQLCEEKHERHALFRLLPDRLA